MRLHLLRHCTLCLCIASVIVSTSASAQSGPAPKAAIESNNAGVRALTTRDYPAAIQCFEEALRSDPTYTLARENLAIANNNYGLQLKEEPEKALKYFHRALWINPRNVTTKQNLDAMIKLLNKNPQSFTDRLSLARQAQAEGDTRAAVYEFNAALTIEDDPATRAELAKLQASASDPEVKNFSPVRSSRPPAITDESAYLADVQRRILRHWFPPKGHEKDRPVVMFKIHRDGQTTDIQLKKRSRSKEADNAALKAVQDASPFRPTPEQLKDPEEVQFVFEYAHECP